MKHAFYDVIEAMHQADPAAQFSVKLWNGEAFNFGDQPDVVAHFKSRATVDDLLANGFLGFGEGYMRGDIDVTGDLQTLLRLGMAIDFNEIRLSPRQKWHFFWHYLKTKNRLRRAPQNIAQHYDRGNALYQCYLDPSMTYSCAYFKHGDDSLEQAQQNKYEHISRKLLLQPGESLLDIGCGWGGMLFYAAEKYDIHGLGITLSKNQFEYVQQQITEKNLAGKVEVRYQDYRKVAGQFDKIVSIGMFEHVGKQYIPSFCRTLTRLLKKGGLGLLHTIGKDTPTPGDPWTLKYIFPGGYIPVLDEIVGNLGRAGFSLLDVENLRLHYAKTLDHWAANYEKNLARVRELFDESFVRQWRLFLHSSAAGFKYNDTRLFQVLFSHGLNNDLPITRAHVYR